MNSSRLVVKESRRMGFMSRREVRQAIYYSFVYKFDLKDPNKIVLSMMRWLKGLKESEIRDMAKEHAIPVLQEQVRPEMIAELQFHRDRNARLVLLSSALPYFCNPMAEFLGMDDVVCSRMEVRDDIFTGQSVGKLVYGVEKAVRMKAYCEQENFPLETAWYYGDAYTDRFVLHAVGNPVVVKPEIKLGWMARRNGWKRI